jgi:hypothetical protein
MIRPAVEAVGAATPGAWGTSARCDYGTHWEVCDCGGPSDHLDGATKVIAEQMDYCYPAEDDAAAICAAVNFIRFQGDELLEVLEACRGVVQTAYARNPQIAQHAELLARIDALLGKGQSHDAG